MIRQYAALEYFDIVWTISLIGICADETIAENARRKARSKTALDKNLFFLIKKGFKNEKMGRKMIYQRAEIAQKIASL